MVVIEDAAQAIDSHYNGKPLGSIGHLAAFSFHETKNVIAGEGGLLAINDDKYVERAEIIWEKGTNRASFFRGEINKYGWVDTGSSFLPSEIIAAFLWAQLENLITIQTKRKAIWDAYFNGLQILEQQGKLHLPQIPTYASNNAHMFYLVCDSLATRSALIAHLKAQHIHAVFHYLSLHKSDFYLKNLSIRKIGKISNNKNINWLLSQGYRVIELDYKKNSNARRKEYGYRYIRRMGSSAVLLKKDYLE